MLMTLKILYQDKVFPLNFKLRHLITHSTSLRGCLKDISDLMLQNSTPDPPSHANPHLSKPSPSGVFSPSSWQLLLLALRPKSFQWPLTALFLSDSIHLVNSVSSSLKRVHMSYKDEWVCMWVCVSKCCLVLTTATAPLLNPAMTIGSQHSTQLGHPSSTFHQFSKKQSSKCILDPAIQETSGLIHGLGRPPGEGNGNPLQYSCLENPMGRGAWQATVHGVTRVGRDSVTKPPAPIP